MSSEPVAERLAQIDWDIKAKDLNLRGWTLLRNLLQVSECKTIAAWYQAADGFRSRVVMARHGFGRGEYRYFSYPLPALIQDLRASLYPHLVPIANAWHERMGIDARFPPTHVAFIKRCHSAGQCNPTPLLLQYGVGDFNCLHQDLYGAHVFPLQAAVLLSKANTDFAGGELVLTEQRPRMQSRVEVVPFDQSDAVVFAVNFRPVKGVRGDYRVNMRHGVSTLTKGHRHTLGIIMHDAK